jgi:hypothetical protein
LTDIQQGLGAFAGLLAGIGKQAKEIVRSTVTGFKKNQVVDVLKPMKMVKIRHG